MVKGVKRAVAAAQIQRRQTPGALIDDNPAMNQARIDAEGYIVSEADLGNVQPDFEQVPKTAAELLLAGFGSRLHSGYLYGSVVRGNAVPRRSTSTWWRCCRRRRPTTIAARRVAQTIQQRCPILADAGVGLTHVDELLSAEERYGGQVLLRELAVCICGQDLRPGLPRTKPGPAVAAGFHRDTPAVLARARSQLAGSTDPQVIRGACRVAARRIVQAAAVRRAFPQWAQAARRAAEQGRQPVADARVVAELLSTLGCWVEQALDHVM